MLLIIIFQKNIFSNTYYVEKAPICSIYVRYTDFDKQALCQVYAQVFFPNLDQVLNDQVPVTTKGGQIASPRTKDKVSRLSPFYS